MGFGKDGKGVIVRETISTGLGTLAQNAGLLMGAITMAEDFRILKSEIMGGIVDLPTTEPEMMGLYLVNGELTLAEAEAAIELDGPTNRNDRAAQELAERFVRPVGMFNRGAAAVGAHLVGENGGPVATIKPRWTFPNPEGWDWMVYNFGAAPTTGGQFNARITHYGVWVT